MLKMFKLKVTYKQQHKIIRKIIITKQITSTIIMIISVVQKSSSLLLLVEVPVVPSEKNNEHFVKYGNDNDRLVNTLNSDISFTFEMLVILNIGTQVL